MVHPHIQIPNYTTRLEEEEEDNIKTVSEELENEIRTGGLKKECDANEMETTERQEVRSLSDPPHPHFPIKKDRETSG